jgi:hypothetical protein
MTIEGRVLAGSGFVSHDGEKTQNVSFPRDSVSELSLDGLGLIAVQDLTNNWPLDFEIGGKICIDRSIPVDEVYFRGSVMDWVDSNPNNAYIQRNGTLEVLIGRGDQKVKLEFKHSNGG